MGVGQIRRGDLLSESHNSRRQAKRLSPPPRWPRHGRAAGSDRANGRLGETVRDLGRGNPPVVQPRSGPGHGGGPEGAPPPRRTPPRPRDRPRDAGDEPRETRLRRRRDRYLWERDQEGEGRRERSRAFDHVPRGQRPQVETRAESGRCDRGPWGVPCVAEGQTAYLRPDGTPGAPPEWLALPEMLLRQGTRHVGTAPDRRTGAARILPRVVRNPLRRQDGLPWECEAASEGAVRDVPSEMTRRVPNNLRRTIGRTDLLESMRVGWHRALRFLVVFAIANF